MAAGPSLGAQLNDMISALKLYEQTTTNTGPQSKDLSFMTLLWPLLPILPPEPPLLVSELLMRQEKCDLCNTSQGTTLTRPPKHDLEPTDTSLHLKRNDRTPLDRLMLDIENKLDETLNSIQETVEKNTELNRKANEVQKLRTNEMSDAELLKTLKKLTKEKAEKMEKVSILEVKEQQLRESLTTAIEWAKSVQLSKGSPENDRVDLIEANNKNVKFGDIRPILEKADLEKTIPVKKEFEEVITENIDAEENTSEKQYSEELLTGDEEINTKKEAKVNETRFRGI